MVSLTLNKNSVQGDKSAATPGGVRIGTSSLTSRSMREPEMVTVASFLARAVDLAVQAQKEAGTKQLADFLRVLNGDGEVAKAVSQLHADVEKFATSYPLPGIPDSSKIKAVV